MNKTKKIVISTLSIIIALLSIGGYAVGNYFVDYAVARKDDNYDDPLSPTYDALETEQLNEQLADAAVEALLFVNPGNDVYMTSFDGLELYAKSFTQENSDLWAIIVHGYTSSYQSVQDVMVRFYNEGYNVLLPDLRSHGLSQGQYISMSYYDGIDIADWSNYIVDMNEQAHIVLHGTSMGGATVMMAAGEENLPSNVFAVIEDCGYTNAYQMFVEQLKDRYGLPEFPIMNIARLIGKFKVGYDFKDANPIGALENATVPILFIHGDEDGYVLPYMQFELYNAYNGLKDILTIEGADHGAARHIDPDIYYNTIFDFINQHK